MQLTIPAHALRDFTRAVVCLAKFGDDLDVAADGAVLKLSTVNLSRSAFAVFIFEASFFSSYAVQPSVAFSVNAKALLAPLKAKSVGSVESVDISLHENGDDPENGAVAGECRLIIRLNCQHGVVKTRRLTYTESTALYARATRNECSSFWIVSSRTLKEWMEHFHVKSGSGVSAAGTDEVGFAFKQDSCVITSSTGGGFDGNKANAKDFHFNSRPISTEITIDVGAFDHYEVEREPSIMFALKEFKAVILIADAISATLSAAFSNGGHPILIELSGDQFRADFVIATSVFYDAATGGFKADEEPVVKSGSIVRKQPQPAGPSGTAKKPLFDPATPPPPGGDDEDEFGDIEFNEDDFAFIDIVSQAHPTQQRATPAPEAPRVLAADSSGNRKPALGLEEDETFGFGEMGGATAYSKQATSPKSPSDEYGSTQGQGPHKRPRWQLFD